MYKPVVLLLGKLPPPCMGPAVATQILLNSKLNERYQLLHVDTNVHESLDSIGTWSFEKIRKNFGIYVRFIAVVQQQRPKLVLIPISQSAVGFFKDSVFILLSRLFGCKTLIQLRGSNIRNWLAGSSHSVRACVESVLRQAQGVIVLGNNLRYLFADYFPEDRIFVVPNGADYRLPPSKSRNGHVKVLYLANLQPSKGIEDVIHGVRCLTEQGVNGFTLEVVGKWRDEQTRRTCVELVQAHNLPVTFHGPAYDVEKFKFMAQADVFVFTPREPEGHPWVIVEALASGLPVISTNQGAIVESVLEGVNGFVVDTYSPEQLADRMRRLITQPTLRARQSEASRRLYQERFTEERMVERMSGAFDALLQHSRVNEI